MTKRPKRYLALLLALLITTSTFYTPAMAASVDSALESGNSRVVVDVSDEVAVSPKATAQASTAAPVSGSTSVDSHVETETPAPSLIQTVISTITDGFKDVVGAVTGGASDESTTAEAQVAMDQADELTKLGAENRLIIDSTDVNVNGDTIQSGDTTIAVFDTVADMEAAKAAMEADSRISTVEVDSVVAIQTDAAVEQPITDDAANEKATAQEIASDVDATATSTETDGLTVAIIDTGVNGIENIDLTGEGTNDENGHGTRMAQLILSKSDNKAKILSIKAIGKDGTGKLSNIIVAINMAIDNNVDIINMSFAMKDNANTETAKQVIQKAIDAGIKVVAAAGNQNDNAALYFPGNVPGVITVGAVDDKGVVRERSNKGACVDYFGYANYTSEAAAMVSGILADRGDPTSAQDIWFSKDVIGNTVVSESELSSVEKATKAALQNVADNNQSGTFSLFESVLALYKNTEVNNNRFLVQVERAVIGALKSQSQVTGDQYMNALADIRQTWAEKHDAENARDFEEYYSQVPKTMDVIAFIKEVCDYNDFVIIANTGAGYYAGFRGTGFDGGCYVAKGNVPTGKIPGNYWFAFAANPNTTVAYYGLAPKALNIWDGMTSPYCRSETVHLAIYSQPSSAYNPKHTGATKITPDTVHEYNANSPNKDLMSEEGFWTYVVGDAAHVNGGAGAWIYNVGSYNGKQVDLKVDFIYEGYYESAYNKTFYPLMGVTIADVVNSDIDAIGLNFFDYGWTADFHVYVGGVETPMDFNMFFGDVDVYQQFKLTTVNSGSYIDAYAVNAGVWDALVCDWYVATEDEQNHNRTTATISDMKGNGSDDDLTESAINMGLHNCSEFKVEIDVRNFSYATIASAAYYLNMKNDNLYRYYYDWWGDPDFCFPAWAFLAGDPGSAPQGLQVVKHVVNESDFAANHISSEYWDRSVDLTKFKFRLTGNGKDVTVACNQYGYAYFPDLVDGATYTITEIPVDGYTNKGGHFNTTMTTTSNLSTTVTAKASSATSSGILWVDWYNTESNPTLRVVKNTYKADGITASTQAGTFYVNVWKKNGSSETWVGVYPITTSGGTGYVDIPVEAGTYRVTEQDGNGNEVYSAGAVVAGSWMYMSGNSSNVQVTNANTATNPKVVTISNKEKPSWTPSSHTFYKIDEYTDGNLTNKVGTQGDASGDLSLAGAQFRLVLDWGNGSKQTLETMTASANGAVTFSDHKVAVPSSFVTTTHAQNGWYSYGYDSNGNYLGGYSYDNTVGCTSTCSANPTIYIEETKAPAGYRLNTEKISISYTISNEGTGHAPRFQLFTGGLSSSSSAQFYEEPYQGQITAQKFAHYLTKTENNKVWQSNTIADKPEVGATFRVWLKSAGSYAAAEPEDRAVITIGSNGNGTTDKTLSGGTYCVQQYTGWPGTTKDTTVYEVTIPKVTSSTIGNYNTKTVGGKQVIDMYVTNNKGGSNKASDVKKILNPFWIGQLTITKRDTYDNGPLNGFEFTLKEYDYTGKNTNTLVLTTGSRNSDGSQASDGTVTFYGLRYGYRYTWQETRAAQGYRLDSNNRGWLSGDNSFTTNSGSFWTGSEGSIMGTDASYNAIRNANWMKSDGATREADTHVPTSTAATLTQGSVVGANGTSGNLKVDVKDAKASTTVYNKRRPGEIPVTKVDEDGNPVSGVTFCLQYSTDNGATWNFITKRTVADNVSVGTTTANVTNYGTVGGCLTTGADGYVNFTGLRANTPADAPSGQKDVIYKLTEVGTDNGHYLLKQSINVGALPLQYPANKINGAVQIGSSGTLSDYTTQNSSNYANRTKASKEFEWIDANGNGNVDANERWFYTLPYEVTNSQMFQVPLTGGAGFPMLPAGVAVAMGGTAVLVFKRKKSNGEIAESVNPFDI